MFSTISESVLKGGFPQKIALLRNIAAGLDSGKLAAATCMPLQALVLDEMIDNDTELIALNSNNDDIFYLIFLRRNHKDHVFHIREYYEEVIPRYTDLHLDLQFQHQFRMSRPTVQ